MKQFNFTYKLVSAYFLNWIFLKLSRKEFYSNELTAIGKEPLCVCYLKKILYTYVYLSLVTKWVKNTKYLMLFNLRTVVKWRGERGGWCNLSLVLYKTVLLPNTYLVYETAGKRLNSIEILSVGLRLSFDRSSYCLLYGRTRRFYDRKWGTMQ